MSRHLPSLALAAALTLAACAAPRLPVVPVGPVGGVPTGEGLATVTIRVAPEALRKPGAYRLLGRSGADVAHLRVRVVGVGMNPVERVVPWTPALGPASLSVQVPVGSNRVFLVSGLSFAMQPLSTLKGVATVTATGATVTVNAATTPAADVLERLIVEAPAAAQAVSLSDLQGFVDLVTARDGVSGSVTNSPAEVDTGTLADEVASRAGAVPPGATASSYWNPASQDLVVEVRDASGTLVFQDATLVVDDPTSWPTQVASGTTTLLPVGWGRWTLSAMHPAYGVASQAVTVPHAGGTITLQLAPVAPADALVGSVQALPFSEQLQLGLGVDGGPASGRLTAQGSQAPRPLAVAGGTAYVGEGGWLRAVDTTTETITTLAGAVATGTVDGTGAGARFEAIRGLACDATRVYVSDGHRIRQVTRATGLVSPLAGALDAGQAGGARASARFSRPAGLALSAGGDVLYVADAGNGRVRRVGLASDTVDTLYDWSSTGQEPVAVVANASGTVYVAMRGNEVWRVVPGGTAERLAGVDAEWPGDLQDDTTGESARFAWAGDLGKPTDAAAGAAVGIALGPDNTLYVSDRHNHRVRRIGNPDAPPASVLVSTLAGGPAGLAEGPLARFLLPEGLALDGNSLLVLDRGNARLRRIDLATGLVRRVAGRGPGGFSPGLLPRASYRALGALALDRPGRRAFVLELEANRVLSYGLFSQALEVVAGSGHRGADDGAGEAASFRLSQRSRLIFDEGNRRLYLSEPGTVKDRWQVRKVDLAVNPPAVTTLASNLTSPGLALSPAGTTLFTADGALRGLGATPSLAAYSPATTLRVLGATATHLYAATGAGSAPDDRIVRYAYTEETPVSLGSEEPVMGLAGSPGIANGDQSQGQVNAPTAVTLDPGGRFLYLEEDHDGLRRIDLGGASFAIGPAGPVVGHVHGLAFDRDGTLLLNVGGQTLTRARFGS
ncbi:MAG: hypothetical protein VKQ33_11500 [Candidatus Sericytochromatia bacterium]|nr:hypothetical protein [Candidatus Sericytochromatia bacterium]